jgi:hypothetical protein
MSYPKCKTCKWYNATARICYERVCSCQKMVYGYGYTDEPKNDEVEIEDDEGWGMIPGPEFGCIHHEEKAENNATI